MKKGKIVLVVVVAFLAIGVISGLIHNLTGTTPKNTESSDQNRNKDSDAGDGLKQGSISENTSSDESTLENNQNIIWKDDDNMGIVNLELDGDHVKEYIRLKYFEEIADYINEIDKSELKDYSYIEFKGNVMKEGKIASVITGSLGMDFIKSSDDVSGVDVENNMRDFKLPKALE